MRLGHFFVVFPSESVLALPGGQGGGRHVMEPEAIGNGDLARVDLARRDFCDHYGFAFVLGCASKNLPVPVDDLSTA
jgi:hypothetical protein